MSASIINSNIMSDIVWRNGIPLCHSIYSYVTLSISVNHCVMLLAIRRVTTRFYVYILTMCFTFAPTIPLNIKNLRPKTHIVG